MPFKEGHPLLADHFTLSKKRLEKLKERLDKNEELRRQYDEIIKDQLKCGVIEKLVEAGAVGNVTYLPHREVIRNDKSSTKVRVVYDGGVKRKNKVNEALQKGPALNTHMYELLLKFRIYPIVITADIEKAYLQIEVDKKHRNFLRFLWYLDVFAEEAKIVKYRFCRVTFGITPSQYLRNS